MKFSDLEISNWLIDYLNKINIKETTKIQKTSLPYALNGHNILANAMTGTGKTLVYVIPILEKLAKDPIGIFSVIISPTRELAIHIDE